MGRIGMCVEIKVRCEACGNPLPVNALTTEILCPSCRQPRRLDPDAWQAILEDAFENAPQIDLGSTLPATITAGAAGPVDLVYGHENPRCQRCATDVEVADLEGLAARGFGFCTACGARMSVRHAPAGVTPLVPASAVLVGEDENQIAGSASNREATVVARWWLWFDATERSFTWRGMVDVVVDGQGNLYCIAATGDSGSNHRVVSLDPQLELRWARPDLALDEKSRISLTSTGNVVVGDQRQRALRVLSCADGATVGMVGGTARRNTPGILDIEGADGFAIDTDGSIIVLAKHCFRRYAPTGREIEPWPGVRPARLVEGSNTGVDELRHLPVNFRTESTQVSIGWDGFTYLESGGKVAKLDRQGRVIYQASLQLAAVRGRPRAPTNGWLNVLGKLPHDELEPLGLEEAFALVIVSPDGRQQRRFLLDQGMGGPLGAEDQLAVTPEGFIWLLDHGGRARLLGPDGAPRFVSEPSRAQDEARRQERQQRSGDG